MGSEQKRFIIGIIALVGLGWVFLKYQEKFPYWDRPAGCENFEENIKFGVESTSNIAMLCALMLVTDEKANSDTVSACLQENKQLSYKLIMDEIRRCKK